MKIIDLHTHSTISDGSMSPSQLVEHAINHQLSAIALTDHDTITGIEEAMTAAAGRIEMIPGIELSAYYLDREVHIVGLFIDHTNAQFQEKILAVSVDRSLRNLEIIDRMQKYGIDITPESIAAEEGYGILTRANFANYLRTHNIVKTNQEAFTRFLDKGRPFYMPRKKMTPEDAINTIKLAGGIPILAHPLLYKMDDTMLDTCVSHLKDLGIRGMEVYYSRNKGFDTIRMKHLADKYQLLYSGGSDFHGTYKPDIEIGTGTGDLRVPYEILEKLKNAH